MDDWSGWSVNPQTDQDTWKGWSVQKGPEAATPSGPSPPAAAPPVAAGGPQKGMGLWDATKTVLGNDVQDLVNMFKLPGDVYSGKKDINDPNVQNEAIGLGTNIALGMRPMDAGAAAAPKVTPEEITQKTNVVNAIEPKAPSEGITPEAAASTPDWKGWEVEPQAASAAATPTADILKGTVEDNRAAQPRALDGLKKAAQNIQGIFAPETLSPEAGQAAGAIRQEIGRGTRASEQTKAALQQYQKQVNAFSPQDKLDLIDVIQSGKPVTDEVDPLVSTIKKTFDDRRAKLEALPATEKMDFIENYYPQQWKNPEKARQFAQQFGSKEGNKGFAKKRSIPTMADGIRAGLEPITTDPIDGTLRYVENVDRYIGINNVFDRAVDDGMVSWRAPGNEPEGWQKVEGRQSQKFPGQYAYAPPGWAEVYNNFISKGFQGRTGDLLSNVRAASNAMTGFKLSLSGYHAAMTAQEAMTSGIADAIDKTVSGHPLQGIATALKAPAKPISGFRQGRKFQSAYLDEKPSGNPQLDKIVQLATDANFRVAGKGRVADEYRFSGAGSYLDAIKRGSLKAELMSDLKDIQGNPIAKVIPTMAKQVGRALETISDPLFKYYIPAIKNSAFYDGMKTWLDANPDATNTEQVAYARKMSDIIDDRFGEMNHDNIFWKQTLKQASQLALLSYSYDLGTLRSFGGAAADVAKAPVRALRGQKVWTPKMSYAVATPLALGITSSVYQYLHTGKKPEDVRDLIAPQTGGVDVATGEPERAETPNYFKQLLGLAVNGRQELNNKLSPLVQLSEQLWSGKDWRGDPIAKSTDNDLQALWQYLQFIGEQYQPISMSNPAKAGSNISGAERAGGVTTAPMYLTDPQGFSNMMRGIGSRADKLKARHDVTQKARTTE